MKHKETQFVCSWSNMADTATHSSSSHTDDISNRRHTKTRTSVLCVMSLMMICSLCEFISANRELFWKSHLLTCGAAADRQNHDYIHQDSLIRTLHLSLYSRYRICERIAKKCHVRNAASYLTDRVRPPQLDCVPWCHGGQRSCTVVPWGAETFSVEVKGFYLVRKLMEFSFWNLKWN